MDSRLPPWEQNPAGPPPPSRLCPQGHILALIDGQPPSYCTPPLASQLLSCIDLTHVSGTTAAGCATCAPCICPPTPTPSSIVSPRFLGSLRGDFVWFMVTIQVPFVDSTCAPRAKSAPPPLPPEQRSIPPPPCISICTLISTRQARAFENIFAPKLALFLSAVAWGGRRWHSDRGAEGLEHTVQQPH